MDTLADLILASSEDAEAIVTSEYPLGSFRGVNVDGLDPVKLASLHSLFSQKGLDELRGAYRPVAEASDSGPWLVRLPADLIECLANIAPQDQPSSARQWAQTEPLVKDGWSQEDAEQYLAQVAHFSQTAAFERLELYLCIYS